MPELLTPQGSILGDGGHGEEYLTPFGAILAEDGGGAAFALVQVGVVAVSGVLSTTGDIDLTLPGDIPFDLNQSGWIQTSGVLGVFAMLEFTVTPPPIADFAQYLTPYGGILTKQEGDVYQTLFPLRGSIIDHVFAVEFTPAPGSLYLTPFGGFLLLDDTKPYQFIHTQEGIVDDDLVFASYERLTAQYITPFGVILEKTDGENFQELLPRTGFVDNNYEFAEDVISYDLSAPVIAFQWQIIISGDAVHDAAGPAYEVEGPLHVVMFGALGVTGDLNTTVNPFDVEGPALEITPLHAVVQFIGDLQYGIPTDIPWNFTQVGAFTVHSTLTIAGDLGYTLRPDEPHDITQVGAVALNGTLKVLGQVQSLRGFELLTQPIAINGLMTADAPLEVPYPSVIDIIQLGEIQVQGALTLGSTFFRFDSFTEGLPRGWYVDGPILETVPNPNYGTAYGNAFFRRWTWKGYDPAGTMVAASGSEQDCFAQTLAVCQSRHQENWRELSR